MSFGRPGIKSVRQPFTGVGLHTPSVGAPHPKPFNERRLSQRFPCDYPVRIVSGDRSLQFETRMVDVSAGLTTKQFCECEAPWKSDEYIGVQFLDILGPSRRRRFLAGEKFRCAGPTTKSPLCGGAAVRQDPSACDGGTRSLSFPRTRESSLVERRPFWKHSPFRLVQHRTLGRRFRA